jgi:hypothetical protein
MEGKRVSVVALDYDGCGKLIAGPNHRNQNAKNSSRDFARLLNESHSTIDSHLLFVSFSNRQSDAINGWLDKKKADASPTVNLDHLSSAVATLREWGLYIPASVDARYFLEAEMGKYADEAAWKAYVQRDLKEELYAKIKATYPNADRFIFVDDKMENLACVQGKNAFYVQLAPLIQPPGTVRYNEKAF